MNRRVSFLERGFVAGFTVGVVTSLAEQQPPWWTVVSIVALGSILVGMIMLRRNADELDGRNR